MCLRLCVCACRPAAPLPWLVSRVVVLLRVVAGLWWYDNSTAAGALRAACTACATSLPQHPRQCVARTCAHMQQAGGRVVFAAAAAAAAHMWYPTHLATTAHAAAAHMRPCCCFWRRQAGRRCCFLVHPYSVHICDCGAAHARTRMQKRVHACTSTPPGVVVCHAHLCCGLL